MLPEFLFTVGPISMQELARDDFSLLTGGDAVSSHLSDKDMCSTPLNRVQNHSPTNSAQAISLPKQLPPTSDNPAPTAFSAVKLEDTNGIDLFPSHPSTWQQHPMNSHDLAHHRLPADHQHRFDRGNVKLLLQGSDDPLISHGANSVLPHDDEHPADFAKSLLHTGDHRAVASAGDDVQNFSAMAGISQLPSVPQRTVKSGCSNLTKQQLKAKANLMSARNQQQQQQQTRENSVALQSGSVSVSGSVKHRPTKGKRKSSMNLVKLRFHHQALPPEYLSHYEATLALPSKPSKVPQKSTGPQPRPASKQTQPQSKPAQTRNSHENVRSWLQKIAEIQRNANASKADEQHSRSVSVVAPKREVERRRMIPTQTCSCSDANNNPQNQKTCSQLSSHSNNAKSNVQNCCTTVAGSARSVYYSDLPYMGEITLDNNKPRRGRKPKKADICHLIYKNYGTVLSKSPNCQGCEDVPCANSTGHGGMAIECACQDQPLNLCLRDQPADSYSISSADDESESNASSTTPVTTPSDFARDSMLANNLKNTLTNLNELEKDTPTHKMLDAHFSSPAPTKASMDDESTLHHLTMYYQKLLESGVLLNNANGPIKTIQKNNQLALKIPLPIGLVLPSRSEKHPTTEGPMQTTCHPISLEYPEPLSTPSSIKSENSTNTNLSTNVCAAIVTGSQLPPAPQKRKRSAIFIPPMNTDSTANPTTEVSICKFKFTGGSKPTLQEKKMLSVDAGGNYRYFSGTGDKTHRGYEYFPRESLQQTAGLLPAMNGAGQKFAADLAPPSAGLNSELLQLPESPTCSLLLNAVATTSETNLGRISPKSPPTSPPALRDCNSETCSNCCAENGSYLLSSGCSNSRFIASRKKHALHQLRRSTQREKLEKTFKEQGFLIQTQQVESAEGATYCKFRQLKKFTRYLFRNWKDYLPDNIHGNMDVREVDELEDASPEGGAAKETMEAADVLLHAEGQERIT